MHTPMCLGARARGAHTHVCVCILVLHHFQIQTQHKCSAPVGQRDAACSLLVLNLARSGPHQPTSLTKALPMPTRVFQLVQYLLSHLAASKQDP